MVGMKLIRRVLTGLIVALAALVGGIALSVPLGWWLSGDVEAITNTRIPNGDGPEIAAFVARPEGEGPFPAVIMVHEFWGLRVDITGKAETLAQEGYVVIAPDTFRGRSTSWIPTAIYQTVRTPQERVNADLDAVYAWLTEQSNIDPERIAIIGFCYGGGVALFYSLHNLDLTATGNFYGDRVTDVAALRTLPGPVLGVFGAEDNMISLESVRAFEAALEEADVPHEVTIYANVGHAFVSAPDPIRVGGAQGRAWRQLLGFLSSNL